LFTVSSSLPTAFTVSGASTPPSSSLGSVSYNLDTYALTQYATVNSPSVTGANKGVVVSFATSSKWPTATNYITTSNPLRITVSGNAQNSQSSVVAQFTSATNNTWKQTGTLFDNITNMQLNYPLPNPGANVTVFESANTLSQVINIERPTTPTLLFANTIASSTLPSGNYLVEYTYVNNLGQQTLAASNSINFASTATTPNSLTIGPITGIPGYVSSVNIYAATNSVSDGIVTTTPTLQYSATVSSGSIAANTLSAPITTSGAAVPTQPNTIALAALTYKGPTLEYQVPQHSYYITAATPASGGSANVLYTGESGAQTTLSLQASTPSSTTTGRFQYFTFNVPEITQPATSVPNANVIIGITNQSTTNNPGGALYWLNYTGGNSNAVQYESSQNQIVKAQAGFRTERGSQLASISQTSLTYDMAKSVDTLQFVIGPASSNVTTTTATYGPFGVGAATNLPNVTIANVTAKCVTSGPSVCNVTGLSNLTATPSVTHATTPVVLNTATNPIAVLDTNANNASSLIVVGSKYVNSVAAQIFQNQPALDSAFGPTGADSVIVNTYGNKILVAGYTAQQTVQAGNEFIQQLLQSAST
jgi:hypothetical protein